MLDEWEGRNVMRKEGEEVAKREVWNRGCPVCSSANGLSERTSARHTARGVQRTRGQLSGEVS
jgi:hypothetical protein